MILSFSFKRYSVEPQISPERWGRRGSPDVARGLGKGEKSLKFWFQRMKLWNHHEAEQTCFCNHAWELVYLNDKTGARSLAVPAIVTRTADVSPLKMKMHPRHLD